MNTKKMKLVRFLAVLLFVFVVSAQASDFAIEVVDSEGFSGSGLYDDANSVLGKPTRWILDTWIWHYGEIYACSLVYPAWSVDPNGGKLICSIKEEGTYIIVKFDHKVADDPGNPYGIDFIVFGNTPFEGSGGEVEPDTDMEQYYLNPSPFESEPVRVSVAQEANGPWYTFSDPCADGMFPTNAFAWDNNSSNWGNELDWLRPVDPNLGISDFDGLSVAEAIELYDGSAGGTGFDLKDLDPNAYAALAIDPNTGRKWIQYIKVEYLTGSDYEGDIDGFSDVAGCGDYQHPYPQGDINGDCRVNMLDMAVLAENWMDCSWNCQ